MLSTPDFKTTVNKHNAINKDIRDVLAVDLPIAIDQAKPLAKVFRGPNERATAKKIWDYLRKEITYVKDPEEFQDIKLPRRFHHDKTGDCKSFSINAMAIWRAVYPDFPVAFRYTNYDSASKEPSHVYAVMKDKDGDDIIIDGCYDYFNEELNYNLALPLKWYPMTVRTLSGLGSFDHNAWFETLPHDQQREIKDHLANLCQLEAQKKAYMNGTATLSDCQAMHDNISKKVKKHNAGTNALHWLDIATLAAGRGAYDGLVALNLNGMADKLMILHTKHPDQWKHVADIYYKLGGYEKALLKAAKIGSKHKPLFLSPKAKKRYEAKFGTDARSMGLKGIDGLSGGAIGFAPAVAAAAAVPVMAAIIPAIAKAFKAAGEPDHANEMQAQAQDLVEQTAPGQPLAPENIQVPFQIVPPAPAPGTPPIPPDSEQPKPSEDFGFDWSSLGLSGIGDVWGDIGGALGGLFHAGMKKLRDKLNQATANHPALKQLGNAAIDAGQWVTGAALTAAGGAANSYVNKLNPHSEDTKYHTPKKLPIVPLLIGAGVLFALSSRPSSNPVNGIFKSVKKIFR